MINDIFCDNIKLLLLKFDMDKLTIMFSHIVAISENRCIGKDGKLLWHVPEDLKRFKSLTLNHSVIMGRKTFESIGARPLIQRENIIISSKKNIFNQCNEDVLIFENLNDAISYCQTPSNKWNRNEIFIIGGESIYKQTMTLINKIYLTLIHKQFDGDTFYPKIPQNFIETQRSKNSYLDLEFSFIIYEKI